jgi:hypothetical protein
MKKIQTISIGCGLATILAASSLHAAETLFDNGSAIDYAGRAGGAGYSTNEATHWRVYDNFSFARDLSIESVWFQMAHGTEPFEFSVYADDDGVPGMEIFSTTLNVGDYSFSNFRWYRNGIFILDPGHDFTFDLDNPLTLAPGDYWVSFWGKGASRFQTLGTGSGDGFLQKSLRTGWIFSRSGNTPFKLIGEPVDATLAEIDIKPGSDRNPVNPKSNGVIPVAVLGSIDFDATQVDYTTIVFGPDSAVPVHDGHVEDVDADGFMDMVFHFKTRETGIECGDTDAYLSGATFAGDEFSNADSIDTVGCADDEVADLLDATLDEVTEEDGVAGDTVTGDDGDGNGSTDAAGMDWTMLTAMSLLVLLTLRRRRIFDA